VAGGNDRRIEESKKQTEERRGMKSAKELPNARLPNARVPNARLSNARTP
jgi:hypothetical protein